LKSEKAPALGNNEDQVFCSDGGDGMSGEGKSRVQKKGRKKKRGVRSQAKRKYPVRGSNK